MEPARDPDFHLVRACQDPDDDGFEAAFEGLYAKYRDRVYSIAYRVVGSSADAMDVVQEGFGLLFRKIGSFRFDSLFSTWLFRLVVNCAIDHRRAERSRGYGRGGALIPLTVEAEPVDSISPTPLEHVEGNELEQHIHASLQRLSPKLRAVLVLRYLESMSYEELGQALQISMGTVKSRLARAHLAIERVLRGTLAPFGFDESVSPTSGVAGEPAGRQGEEGVA